MKNQTTNKINQMCNNCYQFINGECTGTTNQVWTNCVYKTTAPADKETKEEITTKKSYKIVKNNVYNSNEIYFTEKPSEEIRNGLKFLKMRYNPKISCWYGFATVEEIQKAIEEPNTEKKETSKEIKNDYGVKVGDIFRYSFGYDATLYEFYQVRQILSKKMILVSKIKPIAYNHDYDSQNSWHWTLKNDGTVYEDDKNYTDELNIKKIVKLSKWDREPKPQISVGFNNRYTATLLNKGDHIINEDNYH